MKDVRRSNVNDPDVEPTDDPVITRSVAVAVVAPAASTLASTIEEAFDAHAAQLKAFALAAVRDEDAADDLVQETFLRFVRHVRSAQVPDSVPAWLHRVCANLVVSRGRRQGVARRKQGLLLDRNVGVSAEDHAIRMDERDHLREALGELPVDARAALLMAAAGFSPEEIGQAIGRSTNATSTYICRSRVRLREILASDTDPER
jgi:RNA polymerase sigma-70 factor (ECF subfamily)